MPDTNHTTELELSRLLSWWAEFQNMIAASRMWLPPGMREAQAENWVRAMQPTGDPRFD